ncbi:MAG: PadR family transcriptional regulator, partial [Actinomycetota bacterium]
MNSGSPDRPNATAASLLGFLYWQPLSGGDLTNLVEASIANFWNVTRSQIYRELLTLSRDGLVESSEAGARGRRTFTITDQGRAVFKQWLGEPPGPDLMRSPFLLKFFFGLLLDRTTVEDFVEGYRQGHQKRLEYFRQVVPQIAESDPIPAHVAKLGVAIQEVILDWLDAIPWEHWDEAEADPP